MLKFWHYVGWFAVGERIRSADEWTVDRRQWGRGWEAGGWGEGQRVWVSYAGGRQPEWRPPQVPEAAVHFSLGLLLGRMTPICILFCTGGNVIAAVIGLSCTLSAAWWFGQVAGACGDRVVEEPHSNQISSVASSDLRMLGYGGLLASKDIISNYVQKTLVIIIIIVVIFTT